MRHFRASALAAVTLLAATALATPAQAANVACNDILDGVSVVLDGNVGPCSGVGVTLTNGATLDMNGYGIECDGLGLGVGVNVQAGATVKNGIVLQCAVAGILVSGAGDSTVEHMASYYNYGMGIHVVSSGSSTIRDNAAFGNDNVGIYIASGTNTVVNNSSSDNLLSGFIVNPAGTFLSGNHSLNNAVHGYQIGSGVKARLNTAMGNTSRGFLVNGTGNQLVGNTIVRNGTAVELLGNDNLLGKNLVMGQVYMGIRIDSDANTVVGNRLIGNEGTAIFLDSGHADNAIKKNKALANYTENDLIVIGECGTNVWAGNEGAGNDLCID